MDNFLLKAILALVKLFVKKDVDFERLKVIASMKVLMDRRRVPASYRRKQRTEPKNPLLITLIMYSLFGLFIGFLIYSLPSLVVGLVILHAYIMFMMAMTLVTDFSAVLLDTTDNQIILPTPVTSRTIFVARLVHILVYLLQFTIALALFPLLAVFVKYGVTAGIVTLITLFLTVSFSVFLTYLLYALILRFGNEQKIRDIVGYFQIFMTVFFAVGFQVVPRLIDFENVRFSFNLHWYSYLLPPVWMAKATEAFYAMNFSPAHLSMIAAAMLIPVFTIWFMVKFLAPAFSRKLGALNNQSAPQQKNIASSKKKSLSEKLSAILCGTATEKAGFEMVWKLTGRERSFKMQFYPSLAYLLVFAFVFVFRSGKNIAVIWQTLPQTKLFLWFVYLPMFSISSGFTIAAFSENYNAAWIYQSAPLLKPGEIISGSLKSLLTKFFIPIFLLLFAFAFFIWGPMIIDDFVFGFFNNIMIYLLIANLSEHYLPFSRQPNIKEQSGKFVRAIVQLVIIGMLIGAHFLALKISWLPLTLVPVSAICAYLLLQRIRQLPWMKISV